MTTERNLLLVDDEPNIINALKRSLRPGSYRIFTADSGAQGLEVLSRQAIGVIISDQRMPAMSGTEFLSVVKERYPETVRIVLSGYSDPDSMTDAINIGAVYKFISKPWQDDELRASVEDAFKRYELSRENLRLMTELQARNMLLVQRNQETRQLLGEIVQQNSDGLVVVDTGNNVQYFNVRACQLLQKDAKELLQNRFPLDYQAGKTMLCELPGSHDETLYVEISTNSIINKGNLAYLITLHDVSVRIKLQREKAQYEESMQTALLQTMKAVVQIVHRHDAFGATHQSRVAKLAQAIATQLGLPDKVRKGIEVGAMIHDIGKSQFPSELLNRQGPLREDEKKLLQQHTVAGYSALSAVEFPWPIAEMVLQHHERLDGSGYPQGLQGDEIIVEARILGLADSMAAMTADRPYRKALTPEEALREIEAAAGTHFDPLVVQALKQVFAAGFRF
ncbi:MAG: HD domain-containing phosphohydrolase [Gammaproteobacteria bacterium]